MERPERKRDDISFVQNISKGKLVSILGESGKVSNFSEKFEKIRQVEIKSLEKRRKRLRKSRTESRKAWLT